MTPADLLNLINQAATQGWPDLDLAGRDLTELPPEIGQLSHLRQLKLGANQLSTLPSTIGQLQQLQHLDISSNHLSTIPPEVGQLTNLRYLDISSNQLNTIPPEIGQLTNLQTLYLHWNQLSILPPEIGQLTHLQTLYLNSNHLSTLPPEIVQLENLQTLVLRGNPLADPPPEIINAGTESILNYLRQQLEQGKDYLYEAKLLIVGEGGAGKTSLAQKLLDPSYELDAQEASTEGIDVLRWEFLLPNGTPFRVNIWDFGGQEIYHATHQFFLTKRSLYALVVDTRQDNTDLLYWLSVINLLSDSSPILIIKNEKHDRQCEVNERQLRAEFTCLKETLSTNLSTNRGLAVIAQTIQRYITNLPHVGAALPQKWVDVRRALETDQRNYISVTEYCHICDANGFTDSEDQLQLSDYLHDLGVCLHFQRDPVLKHYVILKPEWGTEAVYKALDTPIVKQNYGCFTRTHLNEMWHEPPYTHMRDELLQLMMRFKLCYEIPGRPQHYIAPQLLDPDQPDYPWDNRTNLILRYRYDFMPKGILTRLIVELNGFIQDQQLVWKTGVVLTNDSARAEVIEDSLKSEIRIRVSSDSQDQKQPWLSAISHELEKIHRSYEGLQYQTLIPCNCPTCEGSQTPHDYPFQTLQQFLRDKQSHIQCQRSYQMVDVRRLIDDIFLQNWEVQFATDHSMRSDGLTQGLPITDTSGILNRAPIQHYQESPALQDPIARAKLIQRISALPPPQFEQLLFALDVPLGVIASADAQGSRAKALLDWAKQAPGVGLPGVLAILNELGF